MRALKFVAALVFASIAGVAWGQPVKIRVAFVVPVANWSTILFEKPGLARHLGKSYSFEAVHFQGTPPMITALANNELEIADLAFASLAIAVQNAGMNDLRVIADEFQDGVEGYYTDEFFVLKDSQVRTVKDLKGKVLATNAAVGWCLARCWPARCRFCCRRSKQDACENESGGPSSACPVVSVSALLQLADWLQRRAETPGGPPCGRMTTGRPPFAGADDSTDLPLGDTPGASAARRPPSPQSDRRQAKRTTSKSPGGGA